MNQLSAFAGAGRAQAWCVAQVLCLALVLGFSTSAAAQTEIISGQGMRASNTRHSRANQGADESGRRRGAGRLDENRDGAISRQELIAEHNRQLLAFDRADVDRDGKLTRDELKGFRKAAKMRNCR